MSEKKTVRLYACGGAAVNIAKPLYVTSQGTEAGFAEFSVTYVDTSRSNIGNHAEDAFYLIQGQGDTVVDGSGKVRETNYAASSLAVPDILHQFKPADLNIVLHSASGGSGSILGPILASELIAQGKNVIVMMIGSTTCEQEIRNTINTVLSYQGISQKRSKPVNVFYFENGHTGSMRENDSTVLIYLMILAAAWSGKNLGLDSKDLENFLNYDRVSKYPAALTGLIIRSKGEKIEFQKGQAISSVVSLIRDSEDPHPGMVVGYHSYGILSEAASMAIKLPSPIHLCTLQGFFAEIISRLQAALASAEELYRVNQVAQVKVTNAQDDGLVL